jgi:hypothetical protein
MSKIDAMRAMREAKFAERQTGARSSGTPATRRATTPPVAPPSPTVEPTPVLGAALCGHRSMNGRTCTREQGHAAKSHRYG